MLKHLYRTETVRLTCEKNSIKTVVAIYLYSILKRKIVLQIRHFKMLSNIASHAYSLTKHLIER